VEIQLTKDAEFLLCIMYEAYKARRKNGMSSFDAKTFGSSEDIREDCIPEWSTDDIDDAARALQENGLLCALFVDGGELGESLLSDDGIAYMENRFTNRLDKLVLRIATLRSAILG